MASCKLIIITTRVKSVLGSVQAMNISNSRFRYVVYNGLVALCFNMQSLSIHNFEIHNAGGFKYFRTTGRGWSSTLQFGREHITSTE